MHQPITLGTLIDALKERPQDQSVQFDFGYFAPDGVASYRGFYDHLALGYKELSYPNEVCMASLLATLEAAVGTVYEGYKGGDFRMDRDTPMWVANYGDSPSTCVIDVTGNNYQTVILTGWCDSWPGSAARARQVILQGLGFGNTHLK